MVRLLGVVLILTAAMRAAAAGPVTASEVGVELARVASMDLMLRENPRPSDYLLVANALSLASSLAPGDAEIARLGATAAWSAGDRDILLESTRSIIRADPSDTVAQLRLISANINERQTAEERLTAYERFLGPQGKSLDASVRSSLALDAALLAREVGQSAKFEQFLRSAVDLDSTNKSAVSLAARTFTATATDPGEVIDWQVRLLLADPFDPHVHLTIARICAGQGVLDSATRFVDNAITLYRLTAPEPPPLIREQRLSLLWQQEGPQAVLRELNGPLETMRTQAGELIQARIEAGEPYDDIKRPEDIRYDLGIEKVRLLAANAAGDEATVAGSLVDLSRSTDAYVQEIAEAIKAPGADLNAFAGELVRVFTELQVMRGIVGRDTQFMADELATMRKNIPGSVANLQPVEAWIAYAGGDAAAALEKVGANPGVGSFGQLLAALANEKLGNTDEAVRAYQSFAFARPLEALGAFSRTRLRALGASGSLRSEYGPVLARKLAQVPAWLDRILGEARSFMLLEITVPPTSGSPLLPGEARLRLRNTAPIPLAVGASRPIGSRILVAPRPASAEAMFAGDFVPKVVELDRRLRLRPLEEIEISFDPDAPYSRWLRVANAHVTQRDRYRAIQSFQLGPMGGLINGPLGLIAESRIIQRPAAESLALDVEGLIGLIGSEDAATLRPAIIATVTRMMQEQGPLTLERTERESLAAAWLERFARSSPEERALILLWLPHGAQVSEMEAFDTGVIEIIRLASEDGQPAGDPVLAAAMLTRVRTPESPVFELAAASESGRVRSMAALLSERARSMGTGYATAGPGVGALAPPSDAMRRKSGG